jgi:hypothetical protein
LGETENILIISAIFLLYYLLYGVLVYRVAKRTGMPDAWMGFVPILNIFLVWEMSRRGAFFGFMILLLSILSCGFFGGILLAIAWDDIAERVGRSPWYGYATIIPLVGIFTLWLMGQPKPLPVVDKDYRLRARQEDDLAARLYQGGSGGSLCPRTVPGRRPAAPGSYGHSGYPGRLRRPFRDRWDRR